MTTLYQFAINNTKAHIRSTENQLLVNRDDVDAMNVFDAAKVLSVAFMKNADDVLTDLLMK
jgi:hypothetical protein